MEPEEVSLVSSGACGAFVHSLEDEFMGKSVLIVSYGCVYACTPGSTPLGLWVCANNMWMGVCIDTVGLFLFPIPFLKRCGQRQWTRCAG